MRDPNRIDPIIDKLREAWKAEPDMRLGQLVMNAARYGGWKLSDIWEPEDDLFMRGLDGLLADPGGKIHDARVATELGKRLGFSEEQIKKRAKGS